MSCVTTGHEIQGEVGIATVEVQPHSRFYDPLWRSLLKKQNTPGQYCAQSRFRFPDPTWPILLRMVFVWTFSVFSYHRGLGLRCSFHGKPDIYTLTCETTLVRAVHTRARQTLWRLRKCQLGRVEECLTLPRPGVEPSLSDTVEHVTLLANSDECWWQSFPDSNSSLYKMYDS